MRYRALVVDDEHIILNGMMRLPVWLSLDMEPVPAMNGLEALRLVEETAFDLVITDIRMPEMDGLEFIAALRKTDGEIPVVVLSGYDSFEYAKTAIRYGVVDYLLKPVSQMDLMDTISRIVYEIEEQKEREKQETLLRGALKQTVYDAGAKYLESCLLGNGAEEELERILGVKSMLLVCSPMQTEEGERVESLNALLGAVKEMIFRIPQYRHAAATLFMDDVVLALNLKEIGVDVILQAMKKWSEEHGFPFAVAYKECRNASELVSMYTQLTSVLSYRFYRTQFCILTEEDTKERMGEITCSQVEEAVKIGKTEAAYEALDEVLASLVRQNSPPSRTREICTKLYLLLAGDIGAKGGETGIAEFVMARSDTDFEGLAALLHQLLHHYEIELSERKLQTYSSSIRTAISYVHSHLPDEHLSLSLLANQVLFIHPDYFGKRFKKETGMSFSHYVLDLRMELARSMITERPDIKVYELSEMTGFGGNAHYFSQVFRASCGCTPSEYKKVVLGR